MNPKTLTMLGALALLAFAPAASANNLSANVAATPAVNDSLAATAASSSLCYLVAIDGPGSRYIAADANTPAFTTNDRFIALTYTCPGVGIPGGCTLTFALALASATLWYESYVYNTPISPANEVSGAATFSGMVAGATLTWVSCV